MGDVQTHRPHRRTPAQADADAYEEALDLCCYLKKVLMEREDAGLPSSTLIERRARPFSAACETIPAHESGANIVYLRCPRCLREQCVC